MIRSVIMLALLLSITACMVKCAWGAEVTLVWDAPPAEEQIRAWKVFRGIEVFEPTTEPRITIDIPDNQISTIHVRAENILGEHSEPAVITVIPFVPKHSTDLKTWHRLPSRVIFLEAKPRLFMSYDFPKP